MPIGLGQHSMDNVLVVGDKVLIKPKNPLDKTKSGLYLPASVQEKEKIQAGYVIKVGPGYPLPMQAEDEAWKAKRDKIHYLPLQTEVGDLALFLANNGYEISLNNEKYILVSQSSILMLIRDEGMFK